ncbi:MAG: glutaredoxin family protein [Pseudomonadota bacterium]|nr:glutaredoxin family protein [Pseudomonadota bacterium]
MPQSLLTLSLTAAALLAAAATQAQVYRVVGPDGRVTYSDTPPAASARETPARAGVNAPAGGAALPYALGQTAQRYPVTLYTGNDCAPCASGRNLLIGRGIPFTERTVSSGADIAAMQRQFGDASLPALTIGGQQLKGFSESDWTQYLSAAGYPETSALPGNYQRPAPTPLVAAQARPPAPAADAASAPAEPAAPSVAPARTTTNPAGIRF